MMISDHHWSSHLRSHLKTRVISKHKSFENTQWRKVIQTHSIGFLSLLQKMMIRAHRWSRVWLWLFVLSGNPFDDSFENTQWRKVKQTHSIGGLSLFPIKMISDHHLALAIFTPMQAIWGLIWKHTVEKNLTNAFNLNPLPFTNNDDPWSSLITCMVMALFTLRQVIWKHSGEKLNKHTQLESSHFYKSWWSHVYMQRNHIISSRRGLSFDKAANGVITC